MRSAAALALVMALAGCAEPGDSFVGFADGLGGGDAGQVLDVGGELGDVATDLEDGRGQDAIDFDTIDRDARPPTPPPEGVCEDGPPDGEEAWCLPVEETGAGCKPASMQTCCTIITPDGCDVVTCSVTNGCWVPLLSRPRPQVHASERPTADYCCRYGPTYEGGGCGEDVAVFPWSDWSDWWYGGCGDEGG